MNRQLSAIATIGILTLTVFAAPAPKDKAAEPDGPITPEQLKKAAENLKQLALAFHSYNDNDKSGALPVNHTSKDNKPLLSWRVQILPYLGHEELYKQFKLDEPWDSAHNKKLIDTIPADFVPIRGKATKGMTFYQVFGGEHGLFAPGAKPTLATIPDGTSNTFMIAEAGKAVIWTKPEDMDFDGKTVPPLGGMFDGKFHAVMGDGSVNRFRKNVEPDILKMLIDPADGMALPNDIGVDTDEKTNLAATHLRLKLRDPMKAILSAAFMAMTIAVAFSAPAGKAKVEPLPPPTEEQLRLAQNNLKQIALSWHNFESANAILPSNELNKEGKALLSWRVQVLPYLEETELYKQFKLDEPWDSENNTKLIDKMPKIFAPIRVPADKGMTFYQAFTGKHGLIKPGMKLRFATITDGTSNTLMCVEAAKPVIWTKPDDLVFDGKDLPAVGGLFDGKWHGVMCDGSVRRFKKAVPEETMRRLIDPQDGNVIDIDEAIDTDDKK